MEANNTQKDIKSTWKRRSKLEKQLLVTLIVIVLLTVGLLLFIIIKQLVQPHICTTPACLKAAAQIVNHVDPTVNPCDDFYRFACGKFLESAQVATVKRLREHVQRQLAEIITQPVDDRHHYMVRREKELFQACLNETAVGEESLGSFNETLRELQGWPVLIGYPELDWKEMVYRLKEEGYFYSMMLAVGASPDPLNTNRYIVQVQPPVIRKIQNEHKHLYIKYMTDVSVLFGADKYRAEIEMEKVFDFMEILSNITEAETGKMEVAEHNVFVVQDYQNEVAEIDWLEFINTILDPVASLTTDDRVLFPTTQFSKEFFHLLNKTLKRTQANYIIWSVLERILHFMPRKLKRLKEHYSCLTETEDYKDRSKFCQLVARQSFRPSPSEILYARKYLPSTHRDQVKEMARNVKSEFRSLLVEALWMDKPSKRKALEKLDNLVEVIGAPGNYFSDTVFEQLPKSITEDQYNIETDGFFRTMLLMNKQKAEAQYSLLHMFVNDTKLDQYYDFIKYVDAMYSSENIMILPVGILQDVFYDYDRPMYLNYGTMGSIIGHELIHGFCETGSKYDKDGFENTSWSNQTAKTFNERTKCMIEDVESYQLENPEVQINGILTLEENIADYTGLRVSYKAYTNWVQHNGNEPWLPGIDYSPYQLFWISAISYECYKADTSNPKKFELHAHNAFRATGPMRNNPDFAKDFQCPTGSKMNPLKKCQVF